MRIIKTGIDLDGDGAEDVDISVTGGGIVISGKSKLGLLILAIVAAIVTYISL